MKSFGLSGAHQKWFLRVHRKHMDAFGVENQKKYSLENVKKVKYDQKEGTINVYYEDNWWHYTIDGQWY